MKISVWDTYVRTEHPAIMHFDILAPENITDVNTILEFGNHYLSNKGIQTGNISIEQCQFCHNEIASTNIIESILHEGYAIIELENCH